MFDERKVEAFIAKYTEVPEGADKAALTPEGLIGLVSAYAEITNGADVSGLTPENVTAMIAVPISICCAVWFTAGPADAPCSGRNTPV